MEERHIIESHCNLSSNINEFNKTNRTAQNTSCLSNTKHKSPNKKAVISGYLRHVIHVVPCRCMVCMISTDFTSYDCLHPAFDARAALLDWFQVGWDTCQMGEGPWISMWKQLDPAESHMVFDSLLMLHQTGTTFSCEIHVKSITNQTSTCTSWKPPWPDMNLDQLSLHKFAHFLLCGFWVPNPMLAKCRSASLARPSEFYCKNLKVTSLISSACHFLTSYHSQTWDLSGLHGSVVQSLDALCILIIYIHFWLWKGHEHFATPANECPTEIANAAFGQNEKPVKPARKYQSKCSKTGGTKNSLSSIQLENIRGWLMDCTLLAFINVFEHLWTIWCEGCQPG